MNSTFVSKLGGESEDEENKRAVDGLHSMKIEEEIFCSLDNTVSVFKGRNKDSLVYVQVKRITKSFSVGGQMTGICNEINVLRQVSHHPRIARLLECYQTPRHVWVISEFTPGNCLRDVLVHTTLGPASIRGLCMDMASALLFLHGEECNLVHGDLRPENVWFTETGLVKLCGFQLTASIGQIPTMEMINHQQSNAEYAPPELLVRYEDGKCICPESDVWTFGITLFESVHGITPFTGTSYFHVCDRVREDQPPYSATCPAQVVQLLGCLLQKDYAKRPTRATLVDLVAASGL
ncbi:hypothetical protein BASA81_003905 [Batrachochytrium salamandrivorans]|nr:hypothetical protein BASA81_003905 [Batrachochytrium salamandrivorans]